MLATTGSLSPRRLARASSVRRGSTSTASDFVVRAIRLAAHAIAADDARACGLTVAHCADLSVRVAHQQVPAEGRDDFGVELRTVAWVIPLGWMARTFV